MAFSHYQQTSPGWGTSQYQFGPPPPITFQPQPSWGGPEFYRAHAATADPYLFDHAWNRVREYGGAPAGGMGVGLHEARHWHRRAYGTPNEISFLAPEELGHAAACEAYRSWIYNKHLYEPLSGDIERQREALTGLAVAEATRILQYSGRPLDQYARVAATEAAAHTANYIFYQTREEDYRSRSRFRTGSIDDPYARDDELLYPFSGGARSHSRHARSLSRHRSYSQSGGIMIPPYGSYSSSMGGMPHSASLSGMPQPAFPSSYSSYGTSQVPMTSMYGAPMSAGSAYGSPMGMGISPSYNTGIVPGMAASYAGSNMGGAMYPRARSNSFSSAYPQVSPSYPQQVSPYPQATPYMGAAMSVPVGMPSTGGQTIVIHKGRKHKHKRSHSTDRDYDDTRSHHSSRY